MQFTSHTIFHGPKQKVSILISESSIVVNREGIIDAEASRVGRRYDNQLYPDA